MQVRTECKPESNHATKGHRLCFSLYVGTHHVQAIEDLVAHITADAHVSSPCGCIERHIGCFVLGLEIGIQFLPEKEQPIGYGCSSQASTHTHKGKQEPLQQHS